MNKPLGHPTCCIHCAHFKFESILDATRGKCTYTSCWVNILMRSCEYFKEHPYEAILRHVWYLQAVFDNNLYTKISGGNKNVCEKTE